MRKGQVHVFLDMQLFQNYLLKNAFFPHLIAFPPWSNISQPWGVPTAGLCPVRAPCPHTHTVSTTELYLRLNLIYMHRKHWEKVK